jgi:uncharacterized membrane protein YgcG
MFMKKSTIAYLAACGLQAFAVPVFAQTGTTTGTRTASTPVSVTKLSTQYAEFAGSQENADALVAGLRDDKSVTLTAKVGVMSIVTPSATFTPDTGKLGVGEINIALSLAKAALEKEGITNPTPTQLAAALNGGTFATTNGPVTMAGVLSQRQAGQGWGQIANSMGVKLGSLMSASKTDKAGAKPDRAAKAGSPDKLDDSAKGNSFGRSGESHSSGGHGGGNSGGGGGKK